MFYAIARDSKDQTKVLSHDTWATRIGASNAAKAHCKVNGLTLDGVYQVNGTERQGNTITKNFKHRKKLRGQGQRTDGMF